jgi:HPt (histidine-containing phosphotransfer) domain-containing protein
MDILLDELATLDEQDALERFGGDHQMYRENLAEFIKGLPGRMERLGRSMAAQQWEDVSLQAHNLKGVSANFGASRLSVLAYRLDEYSHHQKYSQALETFQELGQHLMELNETATKFLTQNKL